MSGPNEPDVAAAHHQAALGDSLQQQRRIREACACYREAIRLAPSNPENHFKLACAAESLNQTGDNAPITEPHLLEAIRLNPGYAAAHSALGQWYRKIDRLEPALRHSEIAVTLEPDVSNWRAHRALVLLSAGEPKAAWEMIEPMVQSGSANHWLAWLYSRIAPRIAHETQALAMIERALQSPGLSPGADGRPMMHFAAATLLDRLGRYDEAFEQARRGNEVLRSVRRPHDPAAHSAYISRKIDYFTPERLKALSHATHGSRRPVFIVGMPRSGTSLVEQVLASHPAVYGAGELTVLGTVAQSTRRSEWGKDQPYPEYLERMSVEAANGLASQYLRAIQAMNAETTYVTDKLPLNFLNLEWVELLLPGSRVIHCTREPLDTCLSCYMTNFATANEFKLDLGHLGQFFLDYRRLMAHWQATLTVPMLEMGYEQMVGDTEQQVRRLLAFLDLPFDERCLNFHENKRQVMTASQDQVRRPIYNSSMGRWKHYKKHLSDVIDLFAAAGVVSSK